MGYFQDFLCQFKHADFRGITKIDRAYKIVKGIHKFY